MTAVSETDDFAGSAAAYDADHETQFTDDVLGPTVGFLARLAGSRRALEFAIGTGRVALPLQLAGTAVDGVDLSEDMVRQLHAKDGSETIDARVGDMTTLDMGRTYGLVYLVFNTIGNVRTQAEQTACFTNAARHLDSGGYFVVEVGVPQLRQLPPGATACVFDSSAGHVGVDEYTDLVDQQALSRHFHFDDSGGAPDGGGSSARYTELPYRFVWPSELDLMAQIAGMERVERWAGWDRSPFTAESPAHVSVWRKH